MSNLANYDKNNQIEILELTIRKRTSPEKLDILSLMEQFLIYEDAIGLGPLTAKLIFRDQLNLVGSYPIVGGEIIDIQYRTPVYTETVKLEMIVAKIGERGINNSSENIQMNQLYLVTPEEWWASNNDISAYHKGTYTDIINQLLAEPNSKKSRDFEQSVGIVEYATPAIPLFNAIKFCATRANSKTLSPMYFWETPTGYRFQSLKELYRAKYNKFLYIEDRSVAGVDKDANKVFNTCFVFEYLEGNDRLTQYTKNAFGADNYSVDLTNARVGKTNNSYSDYFNKADIKLNKYPLNDDNPSQRNNIGYIPYRIDLSHLSAYNRLAANVFMDNLRLHVGIPGDSQLRTGDVVWLEIPARVGLDVGIEQLSSGKWFVRSIKHVITKTTYTQTCELTKDSFDVKVDTGG